MCPRRDEELAVAARTLVLAECDEIARALAAESRVHDSIHAARKAIRRLRAFLALAEPRLPELSVADEALAALGDGLSTLRDAHVAVLTATRIGATLGPEAWAPVVRRLVARRNRLLREARARDPHFELQQRQAQELARQLGDLDWTGPTPGDLRRGLKASRRRVARAKRRARRQESRDALHRWRRRVRKLRMQLDAVATVAPKLAERAARSSHRGGTRALRDLADRLGARLDVEVLGELIRKMPAFPDRDVRLAELADVAR